MGLAVNTCDCARACHELPLGNKWHLLEDCKSYRMSEPWGRMQPEMLAQGHLVLDGAHAATEREDDRRRRRAVACEAQICMHGAPKRTQARGGGHFGLLIFDDGILTSRIENGVATVQASVAVELAVAHHVLSVERELLQLVRRHER
eukprot:163300-Pleurochrysis_carterae.AAC.1